MRGVLRTVKIALAPLLFVTLFCAPAKAEVVDRVVAVINDSIITLSELNAAAAMATEKLSLADKDDGKKSEELRSKMLDGLIEQKLVKQAADRAGIDISEREIDLAVEDVKRQNGLTQESLLLALAQSGLTYKEYREQLKEQIRQVKFINKEIRSKIMVLPEDIEAYWRQHQNEFISPPSYRLNMIFIPSAEKDVYKLRLKAVEDGIKKGEPFGALAKEYSEGFGAAEGGEMGWMKAGELDKPVAEAASKLKAGGIAGPIVGQEGAYFIELVEMRPAGTLPLEDVRGRIQDKLFKKTMDERFDFWLEEVKKYAHIEIRL
ncbi:MAG: SurA N-terminal domain-containing protein [Deltaproteobacteria bacterium]|nr:SurA N-terminal domain-containing protein [Deltaproteobacteria bacterium]